MIIAGEGSKTLSESEEQICLFRWAQWACGKYPELKLLFHVPNEGKRSVYTGARMRSEGLRAGVPDICLPVAKKRYHGLFVEMKVGKNKPTALLNDPEYCKEGYVILGIIPVGERHG